MSKLNLVAVLCVTSVLAGACASQPLGPTVAVMPAPNKPFDVFASEQTACKNYAQNEVAGSADVARKKAVGTALLTTALGAGLGAAVGGGDGAAIGAASGAVAGSAMGASRSRRAGMNMQDRYDIAFEQCMYAKGNQVPGFRSSARVPPPPQDD